MALKDELALVKQRLDSAVRHLNQADAYARTQAQQATAAVPNLPRALEPSNNGGFRQGEFAGARVVVYVPNQSRDQLIRTLKERGVDGGFYSAVSGRKLN